MSFFIVNNLQGKICHDKTAFNEISLNKKYLIDKTLMFSLMRPAFS